MQIRLLSHILEYLKDKDNFVLLWTGKVDELNNYSYILCFPSKIICSFNGSNIFASLKELEEAVEDGYYVAGFICYEVGYLFEESILKGQQLVVDPQLPLLWFGVYENPHIYDHRLQRFISSDQFLKVDTSNRNWSVRQPNVQIHSLRNNIDRQRYLIDILSIKEAIARGETYQVNYTFKHKFRFDCSPEDLFLSLCMRQSASYSAFIRLGDIYILSLSPELLFRRKDNHVMLKPMKGTIKRGVDNKDDRLRAEMLYNSVKDRAENVMIVDLLRNDIGRISKVGSVRVSKLYEIEKYETLFQMTSTIESELRTDVSWTELLRSVFPSGSVTGAPKINTMRIIRSLEEEPRGVYTGSIGFIRPDNSSVFNVAIRTVVLNVRTGRAEMGIGSGITYSSEAEKEFDECLLKAKFLTSTYHDFQLIETMLWHDRSYYLLELHLERLRDSAEYFGFMFDEGSVLRSLEEYSKAFSDHERYRVRMLLFRDGSISLSSEVLNSEPEQAIKKAKFSSLRTDPSDRFLYHKTTNRHLYDSELKKARLEGFYDVIFMNNRGEVTEGAISNIVIREGDRFYTPPVDCGLLNGVYRRHLFRSGFPLEERVLYQDDIYKADEVYLINSVRGMVKVCLDRVSVYS